MASQHRVSLVIAWGRPFHRAVEKYPLSSPEKGVRMYDFEGGQQIGGGRIFWYVNLLSLG